ncbi:hypothetical protein [Guptibacillus spartinae]|uniref:hypothetical protein n=1 Tax=Guptibacillus spartinae TaxID=3025679 RepID=UPI00235E15C0|nr:hypothetical protein [Pseudalkalibacillus spartinae]
MLLKEELFKTAQEKGVRLYNGLCDFENLYKTGIMFKSEIDFFKIVDELNIKSIYYFYGWFLDTEFLIPEKYIDRYPIELRNIFSQMIHEHNEYIKNVDFNEPGYLVLYFLHQGFIHFIRMDNAKMNSLVAYEDMLQEISDGITEEISEGDLVKIRQQQQREKEEKAEIIRKKVLADEDFHKCSNSASRLNYRNRLYKVHPEYEEILKEAGYSKTISFFDDTWKIYKERISK